MADAPKPPQYALVAYIREPVGRFVEQLRRDLYPEHGHLGAHVTVLPPRELRGTEEDAIRNLQQAMDRFAAFDVELGEVESFAPVTPTVFIRVAKSAHRFRDMHVAFNSGALHCDEQWPYMPHLTIVKMPDLADTQRALATSRNSWQKFSGKRTARVSELVFVREGENGHWLDLATLRLREEAASAAR